MWSSRVGQNIEHICTSYVVKRKSESMKKLKQTSVIKMCMCVEWNGMSGDVTNSLSWIIPLLYFSWTWAMHFFFDMPCEHEAYILWARIFSFFFDMTFEHVAYFLWVCIFSYFFITHIIGIRREWSWLRSFYFMDGWWIMLIPSVGILHMNMGIYVILIIWYEKILARITQFDKTQWNNK